MNDKKVTPPTLTYRNKIEDRLNIDIRHSCMSLNFSEFNIKPICLREEFNNHFKDNEHFASVMACFVGKILPIITSCKFTDICEGGSQNKIIHFHAVKDQHLDLVKKVLKEYGYNENKIDQMIEGGPVFSFSASLGHVYPGRIVCHKIDNIVCLLFFDTNHHIYLNDSLVRESLYYENCPKYNENKCSYMPFDCFAFEYLDEKKLAESFGYEYKPINLQN